MRLLRLRATLGCRLGGRAGLEGGPVDGLLELVVGREDGFKGEGELRGAVCFQVSEALFGFVDAWKVAGRDPPEGDDHRGKLLEPVMTLAEQFGMGSSIDVVLERLNGFPDRHIEEHALVFPGTKISGVAFGGLQAPDEAGSVVGESIDFIEAGNEGIHDGIIERGFDAAYIDLCEVIVRHRFVSRKTRLVASARGATILLWTPCPLLGRKWVRFGLPLFAETRLLVGDHGDSFDLHQEFGPE